MTQLEKYAELLVRGGANLQQGQTLFITGYVENYEFVRMAAAAAYQAGAREVFIRWMDEAASRMTYLHGADDLFTSFPDWTKQMLEHYDRQNTAWLHIHSCDPEAYKGVDPKRLQNATVTRNKALKAHSDLLMADKMPWCVAGAPSGAWARKVFPGIDTDKAVDKLWAAILSSARADGDNPIETWKAHCETLARRAEYLNNACYASVRLQNGLGTDLTIRLPEGHIWSGGGAVTPGGQRFSPNIPTEEIFTAPHRLGVDGRVAASMPLVYQGDLVENIVLTFKDGLVTGFSASKNQALLENLLGVDEGAKRLGELALVPYSSPISQSGVLFYDTLYDENASCHIALGEAYPTCLRGSENMTAQEKLEAGLNDSLEHVDFMIGTPDMSITGEKAGGVTEPVFVNGDFVF